MNRHADVLSIEACDVGDLVKIHGDAYCFIESFDYDSEPGFVFVTVKDRGDWDATSCYLPANRVYRLSRHESVVFGRAGREVE